MKCRACRDLHDEAHLANVWQQNRCILNIWLICVTLIVTSCATSYPSDILFLRIPGTTSVSSVLHSRYR
ncbi:hypothetical protein XELAEV_18016169mg [Xenopus laevis]|uniref:Uncharacterized protein n=1 Tax=Xenopus laevis TaxID=8355 RepID=A0A974DKI7_XENLA|nr:hypothetical protein XELAEV_18016169mg [Xenopus laevis]